MTDGFYIQVKNGLLEGKHYKKMRGEKSGVIWLFLWLLDKMTIVDHELGEGKVLGGKPVKYEDVTKDLDISRRTYTRWIKILHEEGYIDFVRTQHGLSITVYKAFKVFGQKADVTAETHQHAASGASQYIDNTVDNTNTSITDVIEGKSPIVSFGNADINEGMTLMMQVIPHVTKVQLNRYALNRLYKKFGKEKTLKVWVFAQKYKDRPYCPMINNFLDLEEKWNALEEFAKRSTQKKDTRSAVFTGKV